MINVARWDARFFNLANSQRRLMPHSDLRVFEKMHPLRMVRRNRSSKFRGIPRARALYYAGDIRKSARKSARRSHRRPRRLKGDYMEIRSTIRTRCISRTRDAPRCTMYNDTISYLSLDDENYDRKQPSEVWRSETSRGRRVEREIAGCRGKIISSSSRSVGYTLAPLFLA